MPKIQIAVFAAAIIISGCSGAPVGWGGTYEVIRKSENSISIKYDNYTESFEDIYFVALDHCAQYGKEAVPSEKVSDDALGAIRIHYFKCE